MARATIETVSRQVKEVLDRLKRLEAKIDECCGTWCIDFTTMPAGQFSPPTRTVGGHQFTFSPPPGGSLEVTPNPPSAPSAQNGLRIPNGLTIQIAPPCARVTVLISNFGSDLNLTASFGPGGALVTDTAPGVNTPAYTFDVTGSIRLLRFDGGSNEADIKRICCHHGVKEMLTDDRGLTD